MIKDMGEDFFISQTRFEMRPYISSCVSITRLNISSYFLSQAIFDFANKYKKLKICTILFIKSSHKDTLVI